MKFEENWPRGFRGEAVQRCRWTDRRTDSLTDIYFCVCLQSTLVCQKLDTQVLCTQFLTHKSVSLCVYGINLTEIHWSVHNFKTHKCTLVPADGRTDGQSMASDHNSSSWAFSSGELKSKQKGELHSTGHWYWHLWSKWSTSHILDELFIKWWRFTESQWKHVEICGI